MKKLYIVALLTINIVFLVSTAKELKVILSLNKQLIAEINQKKIDFEKIESLLKKGANVNAKTNSGSNPLHIAAFRGHIQAIEFFIGKGTKVNTVDDDCYWTPLHNAIIHNKIEAIKLLLANNADISATNKYGETPLHFAAYYIIYSNEAMKTLLENNANINAKTSKGQTPLHIATQYNNILAIKPLLNAGADANVKDDDLNTPLHYAARHCGRDAIKALLYAGADVSIKDKYGKTPYDIACQTAKTDQEIIDLFEPNLFRRLTNKVKIW